MTPATWKTDAGIESVVAVRDETNLMEAVTTNIVPHIDGECDGCLSRAIGHVVIDPGWLAKTGVIDDIEDAMLDDRR